MTMYRCFRWMITGAAIAAGAAAPGQYSLHQWTSFEEGAIPGGACLIGSNADKTVQVVDLSTIRGMPANFYGPEVSKELGRYALRLRANPPDGQGSSAMTGLVAKTLLDRDKLGKSGRALFQADFYLPEGKEKPNLAVLAAEHPEGSAVSLPARQASLPGAFYRFGLTVNSVPYFSHSKPGLSKPVQFLQDRDLIRHIPASGWHRFSILVSDTRVECYVDGRSTVFSPANEKDLRKLLIGVLLTESKLSYDCYVDNLSIQVAEDALRIPESPYQDGWSLPPGLAARSGGLDAVPHAVRDLRWHEPLAAWTRAQNEKRPMLMFFCSPSLPDSDRIEKLFYSTPDAKGFLDRHVSARIDINQLTGSEIARKYGVYKVPTFIVVSPDGKTHRRMTPTRADSWADITAQLRL